MNKATPYWGSFESMPRRKSSASPATSPNKLASRNRKLEQELVEVKHREEELKHRIKSLENEKIEAISKDDPNYTEEELSSFEERFVENIIQDLIENSSKANSTVPLFEFKRLHRVYLAIKNEIKKLRTKYIAAEQDRILLKKTLLECYKNSSESTKTFLAKRFIERNKARLNRKKKSAKTRKPAFSAKKAGSTGNGDDDDGVSLPKRDLKHPVNPEQFWNESPKIVEAPRIEQNKKIGDHGDAVCTVEIVGDTPLEDSRDDVKDSMIESNDNGRQANSVEDRTNMADNRFDWVRYIAFVPNFSLVVARFCSLTHPNCGACFILFVK